MAQAGMCAIKAPGRRTEGTANQDTDLGAVGHDGAARDALIRPAFTPLPVGDALYERAPRLRVTEDRVLIKADREDHAPTQTDTGLYLAASLAAAVDGSDEAESWFVGTIVQLGPLVNRFEARPAILRWLWDAETEGIGLSPREVRELIARVQELPKETPEPLRVGDRVCFSWASGQQIAIDGDTFVVLRAGDVLGVLEEE